MKRLGCLLGLSLLWTFAARAEPLRVALMDFDNQAGSTPSALLGASLTPERLSEKGAFALGKALLEQGGFTLVDRRDFLAQIDKLRLTDDGRPTPTRPSFIQAAQALNTDVVLRGSLLSYAPGKNVVNQGGFRTEFVTLTLRVGLEALDPYDGSVIAMAEGAAEGRFRQTDAAYSELSEDEVLALFDQAIKKAAPELARRVNKREARLAARPKIKLNIKTDADPAMIEIDGILVGSTPIEGLEVYKGDHVLTIGKPGYRDITKRILFEHDASVDVPMLRTELSAEELKEILEKSRLSIIAGDPGIVVTTIEN